MHKNSLPHYRGKRLVLSPKVNTICQRVPNHTSGATFIVLRLGLSSQIPRKYTDINIWPGKWLCNIYYHHILLVTTAVDVSITKWFIGNGIYVKLCSNLIYQFNLRLLSRHSRLRMVSTELQQPWLALDVG